MDNLHKLEINRLIKEFNFVKSDFEYKSELVREMDIDFLKNVNIFLDKNIELKKLFDEKTNLRINKHIQNGKSNVDSINEYGYDYDETKITENEENPAPEINHSENNRENKITRLYRSIVKITHPDKIKKKRLNDIYIEATKYYKLRDIIGIYTICDELRIDYEIDNDEIQIITENILNTKEKISFLEGTLAWNWYNQVDSDKKNYLILSYIRKQLI